MKAAPPRGIAIRSERDFGVERADRGNTGEKRPRLFLVLADLLDQRLQSGKLQLVAEMAEE